MSTTMAESKKRKHCDTLVGVATEATTVDTPMTDEVKGEPDERMFTDIELVASDGKRFKYSKYSLSLCSSHFKEVLEDKPDRTQYIVHDYDYKTIVTVFKIVDRELVLLFDVDNKTYQELIEVYRMARRYKIHVAQEILLAYFKKLPRWEFLEYIHNSNYPEYEKTFLPLMNSLMNSHSVTSILPLGKCLHRDIISVMNEKIRKDSKEISGYKAKIKALEDRASTTRCSAPQ